MRSKLKIGVGAVVLLTISVLLAPMPSFNDPLSTVIESADGRLLGARVSADGQWRFPPADSLPEKYIKALICYEDRWFWYHPGINPVAIIKALADNYRAGSIVRGGSTITMQVARIARDNPRRTYAGKIIEMLSALKLEIFSSKKKILELYASNAPFGGNTIGIDAAAWRYTGRGSHDISWAEAASLAVLPNAPSLVYPGRNPELLRSKRDRLLSILLERNVIDSMTYFLSLSEPLPGEAFRMPSDASHLTALFFQRKPGEKIRTTIDADLQRNVSGLVNGHQERLANNLIFNSAALVVEVKTGNVLAYAGNSSLPDSAGQHGRDVDLVRAPRSTGSIMKPFLYAGLLTAGEMLPNELVPDIPTRFEGFRPENSDFTYSGAVTASDALARSLNIPAVKMLQLMTEDRFLNLLQRIGLTTFNKPPSHYGLSLILGGGEATLWDLAGAYSSMARVLSNNSGKATYNVSDWHAPFLELHDDPGMITDPDPPLSAPAIWLTYEALRRVNRPETETGWQYFGSAPDIAWKTGTSFGFRDAWAIGTTPEYVVAVWAGNADGEGRPGLSGISSAAPLMFDIFRILKPQGWWNQPEDEMTTVKVCVSSGFRAGPGCETTRDEWVPVSSLRGNICPYHKIIQVDASGNYRINVSCAEPDQIKTLSWFVLPPAMEYYYRQRNASYITLPPFKQGCSDDNTIPVMEFIYPPQDARIFIPRGISGEPMSMLPEIIHRRRNAVIYWHLDNKYIGMTKQIHQIELRTKEGPHVITATDERGFAISRRFLSVNSPV